MGELGKASAVEQGKLAAAPPLSTMLLNLLLIKIEPDIAGPFYRPTNNSRWGPRNLCRLAVGILLLSAPPAIACDGKIYAGVGQSNWELEGANSVNMPITAGNTTHSWQSSMIQSADVDVDGQPADSISGTADVRNYPPFAVARRYTSYQLCVTLQQGFTDFPTAQ